MSCTSHIRCSTIVLARSDIRSHHTCTHRPCVTSDLHKSHRMHRRVSHALHHIVGASASHAIAGSNLCFGLSIRKVGRFLCGAHGALVCTFLGRTSACLASGSPDRPIAAWLTEGRALCVRCCSRGQAVRAERQFGLNSRNNLGQVGATVCACIFSSTLLMASACLR